MMTPSQLRKWLLPTLVAILYFLLLLYTFLRAPGLASAQGWSWWTLWFTLCASSLIALCFLATGTLVWLYERQRVLAFVVFAFCASLMVLFLFETVGLLDDPWGSLGGSVATSLAVMMLLFVALVFPRNRLKGPTEGRKRKLQYWGLLILLGTIMLEAILSPIFSALYFFFSGFDRYSGNMLAVIFAHSESLLSTLFTVIFMAHSLLHARTAAERQQLRIMLWGIFGSYVPLVVLTSIPTIIAATITQQSLIDVRLSTLSLILLPLAISYAVLRYRLLILDRFILNIIRSILWLITVVIFSYLAVTVTTALFVGEAHLLWIIISLMVVVPSASWLSNRLARWILSPDVTHYHHLLYEQQDKDIPHASSVAEIAVLFCTTCSRVVGSDGIVLFLLDVDAGAFRSVYWRTSMSDRLGQWSPVEAAQETGWRDLPPFLARHWLEESHPFLQRLRKGKRPLLLSETAPTRWSRTLLSVLNSSPADLLVIPLTTHETLIGFGILASREDMYGYAGPDMSVSETIARLYAPQLQEAIMTDFLSHRERALESLSSALHASLVAESSLEEMAAVLAPRVAETLQVQCEVWKYVPSPQAAHLRHLASYGHGPALVVSALLPMASESDWHATFWEGDRSVHDAVADLPHLLQPPTFPLAWLPLTNAQHRYGVLVLTYDRPHRFSPEEQHVFSLLVQQWTGALERASDLEFLRAQLLVHHKRTQERQQALRQDLFSVLAALRSLQWWLSGQSESPSQLSSPRTPFAENRSTARAQGPFIPAHEPQLIVNTVLQSLLASRHFLARDIPPIPLPGEERAHREVLLILGNTPLQSLLIDAGPLLGYTSSAAPTLEAGLARLHAWSQYDSHDKRAIIVLETMLRDTGRDIRSFARMIEHIWEEQGDHPMPSLVVIREQYQGSVSPPFPTLVLPFSLSALQGALA